MRRTLAVLVLAGSIMGCVTPAPAGPLTLASDPTGATVRLSDGRSCETPCSVPLAGPVDATIAKAGHRAETMTLRPEQRGTVMVTLPPAGRATDVQEVELDLEPAG